MSTNDARLSCSPRPGSVFSDTIKLMQERQKSTLYQQDMLLEKAKMTLYQQDMSRQQDMLLERQKFTLYQLDNHTL